MARPLIDVFSPPAGGGELPASSDAGRSRQDSQSHSRDSSRNGSREDLEPPRRRALSALESIFAPLDDADGAAAAGGSRASAAASPSERRHERSTLLPRSAKAPRWRLADARAAACAGLASMNAAVACALLMTVFAVTHASTVAAKQPWLLARSGALVRLGTLSFAFGAASLAKTNVAFPQPHGVDVAFAPLLAQLGDEIEAVYGDGDAANDAAKFAVFLLLSTLISLAAGAALALLSKCRLLDIAEYLPFAVVCGFLASIGAALVAASHRLAGPALKPQGVSVGLVLLDACLRHLAAKLPPSARMSLVFVLPTLAFYGVAGWAPGSDGAHWFLEDSVEPTALVPPVFDHAIKTAFFSSRAGALRAAEALVRSSGVAAGVIVIVLIKAPIVQAALRMESAEFCANAPKANHGSNDAFELTLLGLSHVLAAVCGAPIILTQQLTLANVARDFRPPPFSKVPGLVAVLLALTSTAATRTTLGVARSVPRFVYAAFVGTVGLAMIEKWLAASHRRLPPTELAVAAAIVALSLGRGLSSALGFGAVASVGLFAWQSTRAPVVKFMATAETFRSNVERDQCDLAILDHFGGRIAVLVVQGFLFFGNGKRLVEFVDAILDDHDEPQYVVLDCAHAIGADSSAIDALIEVAARVARRHAADVLRRDGPPIYVSGAQPDLVQALRRRDAQHVVHLVVDLDRALGSCEARLIHSKAPRRPPWDGEAPPFAAGVDRTPLRNARDKAQLLEALDQVSGKVQRVDLADGDELMSRSRTGEQVNESDALFFVAAGTVSVRHDPQQSTTMLCFSRGRSVPRPGATPRSRAFRLAELGRGSIVGAEEYATKLRRVGVTGRVTVLVTWASPRGPSHGPPGTGAKSRGCRHGDLVTGTLPEGPCHGVLVTGTWSRGSQGPFEPFWGTGRWNLFAATLPSGSYHWVTGAVSQGRCRGVLVTGALPFEPDHGDV